MRQPGSVWAERALVALFLASLAGALNLVVTIHRDAARDAREKARIEAERVAEAAKPAPAASPPAPGTPPPAVAARPKPEDVPAIQPPPAPAAPPEDPTKAKLAAVADATAREMAAAKEADAKADASERAIANALAESGRWKRRELLVSQQVASIADRVRKIDQQVDALAFERDVLARERDALKAAVVKGRQHEGSYAVLPYKGPNGSWRRPIVLECVNGTVAMRPNGPVFSMLDLASMINPRSSPVILAIARELLKVQGSDSPDGAPVVPYFVFLVRPDGIRPYYEVRARLEPLGMAFGYELVEQDMKIDVPDFDDVRTWDGTIPLEEPLEAAPDGKDAKGRKGAGPAGNGLARTDRGADSARPDGGDVGLNWPGGGRDGEGPGPGGLAARGGTGEAKGGAGGADDDSPEAFVWPRPSARGSRPSAGTGATDGPDGLGGGPVAGPRRTPRSPIAAPRGGMFEPDGTVAKDRRGGGIGGGPPDDQAGAGGGGFTGPRGIKGTNPPGAGIAGAGDGARKKLGQAVEDWTAASRGSKSTGRIDPRLGGGTGAGSEDDLRQKGWKVVPDLEAADDSPATPGGGGGTAGGGGLGGSRAGASGSGSPSGVAPPSSSSASAGTSSIPAPEPLVLDGPDGGAEGGSPAAGGRGRPRGETIGDPAKPGSGPSGDEPGGLEWQAGSGKPPSSPTAPAAASGGSPARVGKPDAGGGAAEGPAGTSAASAPAGSSGGVKGSTGTAGPSAPPSGLGVSLGSSLGSGPPPSSSGGATPSMGGLVFGSSDAGQGSPGSSSGSPGKADGEPDFMPSAKGRIPEGPSKPIEVPFEITVACEPDGLVIHPGGYRITAGSIKDRRKDSLLVRQLLAVANQRAAADPLIRPKPRVKFLVEGNGSDTFWAARKQILFSGLGWPMSLQVTGDQQGPRLMEPQDW
ncbi:hypothetical protein OJF2_40750 [Aquisphaera giovannonii]|uniref:Uncharacterized protein n=1 Tax=Aquisphaera giovannonii TaxID=406548 RepID=A0A5B9W4H4_9BACT|nr:hypothetical protein [Aquisphaera giovannonii]QEH35523.1 hypothetical protein OJF2_40750 [Aquisphaera giovannonii]